MSETYMFISLSHWQNTKNPCHESKHFPNNDRLVLQFIDLFILSRKYKELSMIVVVSMLGMGFRWMQHTRLGIRLVVLMGCIKDGTSGQICKRIYSI